MRKKKKNKIFRRHFRIYFKNNHPAYIVDEEGNLFVFHRVTHSKTSGGKKNWEFDNPLRTSGTKMYIVKKEQKDRKSKFSTFELELKDYVDISYPEIKKVGDYSDAGSHHTSNSGSRYESSIVIKSNKQKNGKKNG